MNEYKREKLIQTMLYVLNKTGGLDCYHLFEILYFADLKSLSEFGNSITFDRFIIMEHRPVPSMLYDLINGTSKDIELSLLFYNSVKFDILNTNGLLLSNKDTDLDYLSQSEINYLNESIKENAKLTFFELDNKFNNESLGGYLDKYVKYIKEESEF